MRDEQERRIYLDTIQSEISYYQGQIDKSQKELNYWIRELAHIDTIKIESKTKEYCRRCGKEGSYRECCYQGHI